MKKSEEQHHKVIRVKVFGLMIDGKWRTKQEIHDKLGGDIETLMRRLRDLRSPKYGGYVLDCRLRRWGDYKIYEYRLFKPATKEPTSLRQMSAA